MIRITPKYKHQVFICHAFEDQRDFANGLDRRLRKRNINVWYSARNMPLGDSLETILEKIIPSCRHGIVIISNDYFTADWGKRELEALSHFEKIRSHKIILPIWHGVDEQKVKQQFPYLVDRFAAHSDKGIDYVVEKIIREIKPPPPLWSLLLLWGAILYEAFLTYWLVLVLALAVGTGILYRNRISIWLWSDQAFEQEVERRIAGIDELASAEYNNRIGQRRQMPSNIGLVRKCFNSSGSIDSGCGIFTYRFNDAIREVTGKNRVAQAGINVKDGYKAYGMGSCSACIDTSSNGFSYSLLNAEPVSYSILSIDEKGYQAIVRVEYEEGVRCVIGTVTRHGVLGDCRREETWFYGLSPVEEYVFEKRESRWEFIAKK